MIKIGFDFDDVIANSYLIMRDEIIKKYNYDIEGNSSQYQINIPSICSDDICYIINNILIDRNDDLLPKNNSIELLRNFYDKTETDITIVTARDINKLKNVTYEWLNKYLDIPFKVVFLPGIEKVNYLKENNFTHFIDDRYQIIEQCSSFLSNCYLMDCEWNRNRPLRNNIKRVNCLEDVYNDIFI